MWKQWTNFLLGIVIVSAAFLGAVAGWVVVGAAIFITVFALSVALEEAVPEERRPSPHTVFKRHAH
ncbi:MAG TPA: hypothetical protein VNG29_02065 [Candidatus Paceibacterota bacterium]|nr:hypothetical protein [Candidatus Paceibacterota bacterium]